MLQDFNATTQPQDGPPRLAALRGELARRGLDGMVVPRADAHQGEYVAACDERLSWLTGFTGSAGIAVVLAGEAGLFVDGRYRLQARVQCDAGAFTFVDWPETKPADWIAARAGKGAQIGFDPWLHTPDEIARLRAGLEPAGVALVAVPDNPLDKVWTDRPAPPAGAVQGHPDALAGRTSAEKRADLAETLRKAGQRAAVLTLPDSICWLLNIRGRDVPRVPVVQCFAILHDDGSVALFMDPAKVAEHTLDAGVAVLPPDAFLRELAALSGPVRVDPATAPVAVAEALAAAGIPAEHGRDPCILPKARKSVAELDGARAAHLRDGAAMADFLCWLDGQADLLAADPDHVVTEIDIVRELEARRVATGRLQDLSFDTISGSGPNAAIVHYRVTEASNRRLRTGEVLLVDSGGQYRDGTTDVTRTIALGTVAAEVRAAATRVLQGMMAVARARFPKGVAGAHLDALARYPLWLAGQDFDHGTGHGVGSFLSVHEGPQRLSRLSDVPLEPGMVLSDEPGYYRDGAFGIRIENLLAVRVAPALAGGDDRPMLEFETLTLVPIDRRLIDAQRLAADERAWIDSYHARVAEALAPLVSGSARDWLERATAPL